MSFQRTPSGLSNLHLFYGTAIEIVVFTEGGNAIAVEDALSGTKHDEANEDIKFWEGLFAQWLPKRRCHFRGVGGKQTLQKLADYVQQNSIRNVLICMDADHDRRRKKILKESSILYTYGYSWEVDVWNKAVLTYVHGSLCMKASQKKAHKIYLESHLSDFLNKVRRLVLLDVTYSVYADYCPLSACRGRVLKRNHPSGPTLDVSAFLNQLRQMRHIRQKIVRKKIGGRISAARECNGHLLADYCFELLSSLLRSSCGFKTIPKEMIQTLAINAATYRGKMSPAATKHHRAQLSSITW